MATISMSRMYSSYKPRIIRHLEGIRAAFASKGFTVDEPEEWTDEEYEWHMLVGPKGITPDDKHPDCIDLTLTICESIVRDGEDCYGVSFRLGISAYGWEIITSFLPYNYTRLCWVSRKSPEDVEERWEIFRENTAPGDIVEVVQNFYRERARV